jgi:16S rRNA processing protein RimM
VAKTQGRHGEVAADLLTNFPERFAERTRLFALDDQGTRRELYLEGFWPHKQRLVLKFAGIDSISDAETLLGCEIQIPAAERAALEEGSAYVADLVGCEIVVSGAALNEAETKSEASRSIGRVADIQFGAGEAPLLVIREGKRELLIPLASEYIRRMDVPGKRIEMQLPEGMLSLDAPLSKAEKDSQKEKSS